MPVGKDHEIARELRAARAYADKSRTQIGQAIGVSGQTIGKWERGEFTREMTPPILQAIARFTGMPAAFKRVVTEDSATRFADEVRREAQRQLGHPPSSEEEAIGAGAGGGPT